MTRYRVCGEMTISVYVEVNAASENEAKRIARQAPIMSLCHQCAQGEDDSWSTSGELDGTVRISGVEEA